MKQQYISNILENYYREKSIFARIVKQIFPNHSKDEVQQALTKLDQDFLSVFCAALDYHESGLSLQILSEQALKSSKQYISRLRTGCLAKKINQPEELFISDLMEALCQTQDEIDSLVLIGAEITIDILCEQLPELNIREIADNMLKRINKAISETDSTAQACTNRFAQRNREYYRLLEKELLTILNLHNNNHSITQHQIYKKFQKVLTYARGRVLSVTSQSAQINSLSDGQNDNNDDLNHDDDGQDYGDEELINSLPDKQSRFDEQPTDTCNFRLFMVLIKTAQEQFDKIKEITKTQKNVNLEHFSYMQQLSHEYPDSFAAAFNSICKTKPENYEHLYFKTCPDLELTEIHDTCKNLIKSAAVELNHQSDQPTSYGAYLTEIIFYFNSCKIKWLKALHAVAFQYSTKAGVHALEKSSYLSVNEAELKQIMELFPDYGASDFHISQNKLFEAKFLENLNRCRAPFLDELYERLKMPNERQTD